MLRAIISGTLLSGLVLVTGCGESARSLARVTLSQEVEYEAQLRLSAQQLLAHFNSIDDLKERASVQSMVETESAISELAVDFADRGYVRSFRDADWRAFFDQASALEAKEKARATAQLADLDSKKKAFTSNIESHAKELKALRLNLEKLQEEPDLKDRVKQAADLFQAVRDQQKAAAKPATKPTTKPN